MIWKENVSNVMVLLGVLLIVLIVQRMVLSFSLKLYEIRALLLKNTSEVPSNIELFNSVTNATSILLDFLFCIFYIRYLLISF